jgi:hypothetical protein
MAYISNDTLTQQVIVSAIIFILFASGGLLLRSALNAIWHFHLRRKAENEAEIERQRRNDLGSLNIARFVDSIAENISSEILARLHARELKPPFSFEFWALGSHQPEVRHLVWIEVNYSFQSQWAYIFYNKVLGDDFIEVIRLIQKELERAEFTVSLKESEDEVPTKDFEVVRRYELIRCPRGIFIPSLEYCNRPTGVLQKIIGR